jgi:hypothetical protein
MSWLWAWSILCLCASSVILALRCNDLDKRLRKLEYAAVPVEGQEKQK